MAREDLSTKQNRALLIARLASSRYFFVFRIRLVGKTKFLGQVRRAFFSKVFATYSMFVSNIFEGRDLEEATAYAQLLLEGIAKD